MRPFLLKKEFSSHLEVVLYGEGFPNLKEALDPNRKLKGVGPVQPLQLPIQIYSACLQVDACGSFWNTMHRDMSCFVRNFILIFFDSR